ncbi:hypothetical protein [Sphingomonas fuzhouensis]|uniref:hypothetical protein n=1 Tax=Sphingomonas fuzhouensis TaxID=3106033 RepID=UPI002AFF686F|nr:hypothetical protein [Sphingomonas sp. SGZ-02]
MPRRMGAARPERLANYVGGSAWFGPSGLVSSILGEEWIRTWRATIYRIAGRLVSWRHMVLNTPDDYVPICEAEISYGSAIFMSFLLSLCWRMTALLGCGEKSRTCRSVSGRFIIFL